MNLINFTASLSNKNIEQKKAREQKKKAERKLAKLSNAKNTPKVSKKRDYPDKFVRSIAFDKSAKIPCAYIGKLFGRTFKPSYEHLKPFNLGGENTLDNLLVVDTDANGQRSSKSLSKYIQISRKQGIDPVKNMVKQLVAYDKVAKKIKGVIKKISLNVYNELNSTQKAEFLSKNKFLVGALKVLNKNETKSQTTKTNPNEPEFTVLKTIAEDNTAAISCACSGETLIENEEMKSEVSSISINSQEGNIAENTVLVDKKYSEFRKNKSFSEFVNELKTGVIKQGDKTIRISKTNLLDNINKQLEGFNKISERIQKWIPTVSKTVYKELNNRAHKKEFLEANPYINAADIEVSSVSKSAKSA